MPPSIMEKLTLSLTRLLIVAVHRLSSIIPPAFDLTSRLFLIPPAFDLTSRLFLTPPAFDLTARPLVDFTGFLKSENMLISTPPFYSYFGSSDV